MFNMKKSTRNNIIRGVILFILFNVFDYFLVIPLQLMGMKNFSGQLAVILSTLKSILLAILLFFIYRRDLNKDWDKFKHRFMDNLDIGVKYWFLGLAVMVVSNLIINIVLGGGQAANEQTVQSYITYLPWLMLISAGFVAPFVEEMIFRKSFRDIFTSKWLFVIISGLVFGYMHVAGNTETLIDWLYIIPYGSLGSAFALAYYETDTIFTSITLHMLHNTILLLTSILSLFIL